MREARACSDEPAWFLFNCQHGHNFPEFVTLIVLGKFLVKLICSVGNVHPLIKLRIINIEFNVFREKLCVKSPQMYIPHGQIIMIFYTV